MSARSSIAWAGPPIVTNLLVMALTLPDLPVRISEQLGTPLPSWVGQWAVSRWATALPSIDPGDVK